MLSESKACAALQRDSGFTFNVQWLQQILDEPGMRLIHKARAKAGDNRHLTCAISSPFGLITRLTDF
jgi:hypothetical protein